jgi:hypothetical protein
VAETTNSDVCFKVAFPENLLVYCLVFHYVKASIQNLFLSESL